METSLKRNKFSNALLSGLLAGVIAAALNLVYSIVYRDTANFGAAKVIMPFSIFIGFPIVLALWGCAYFLFKKYLHASTNWFIFFCIVIMVALVLVTIQETRQNTGSLLSGLRGLCFGMEIITCMLAAFLIPYFARHPKIYG